MERIKTVPGATVVLLALLSLGSCQDMVLRDTVAQRVAEAGKPVTTAPSGGHLTVTGTGILTSGATLDFPATKGGNTKNLVLTIANTGSTTLTLGTVALSGLSLGGTFTLDAQPASTSLAPGTQTTVSFTFHAPAAATGTYTGTLSIPSNDPSGPFLLTLSGSADSTAPLVQSSNPSDLATGVSPLHPKLLTVVFNEAMDPATVTSANLTLFDVTDNVSAPATVTYNPATRTATLNPGATIDLEQTKAYRITLGAGLKDAVGNAMAVKTLGFTTKNKAVSLVYQGKYANPNSTYPYFSDLIVDSQDPTLVYVDTENNVPGGTYGALAKLNVTDKANPVSVYSNWGPLKNGPGTMLQDATHLFTAHSNATFRISSKGNLTANDPSGLVGSEFGEWALWSPIASNLIVHLANRDLVTYGYTAPSALAKTARRTGVLGNQDQAYGMVAFGYDLFIPVTTHDQFDYSRIVSIDTSGPGAYSLLGPDFDLTNDASIPVADRFDTVSAVTSTGATDGGNTLVIAGNNSTGADGIQVFNVDSDYPVFQKYVSLSGAVAMTSVGPYVVAALQGSGIGVLDLGHQSNPLVLKSSQALNGGKQASKVQVWQDSTDATGNTYYLYILAGTNAAQPTEVQIWKLTLQ